LEGALWFSGSNGFFPFDNKPGGVYAAERILEDPDHFIGELRQLGIEIFESPIAEIRGRCTLPQA